jgi:FkbM family methyltransferase
VVVFRLLRKYSYYLLSIFELLLGFDNPILLAKIYLNLTDSGIKTVRLRNRGLHFRVRGAMDVWSIKETFLDRFYEKYGFTIQPDWKIIDIGAGIGDYTLYAVMTQPNSQVFSFEPYSESFMLMQENLRLNSITNVQVFDEAISAASGELILDLTGGEPLQFQSHLQKTVNVKKSLSVSSLSLADALSKLGVESCDLLKLDCEGAEYSILFNTPQPILEHIQRIVMEYHDNLIQHNHKELARFLNERGFQVETFPNPVHSHLGYLRAIRKITIGGL